MTSNGLTRIVVVLELVLCLAWCKKKPKPIPQAMALYITLLAEQCPLPTVILPKQMKIIQRVFNHVG
jgi:hypothetical protein